MLARDLQLYANFDSDCNGLIDEGELHLVLQKLGMHTTLAETRKVLHAWDTAATGTLDLPNFSQLVADVRTFRDFDLDFDGKLNEPELRSALRSLGVDLTDLASTLTKYEAEAHTMHAHDARARCTHTMHAHDARARCTCTMHVHDALLFGCIQCTHCSVHCEWYRHQVAAGTGSRYR